MIVEYYIEQWSLEMCVGCFEHNPHTQKPYWAAVTYWLVPGTFEV